MTPTIVLLLFAFIHQGIPCHTILTRRLPQITYHPVDGGVIAAQEEAYRLEMKRQETSTVASEDEGNSTASCRVCTEEEQDSPRFFFDNLSEGERQVPCCTFVDGEEVQNEEASETNECRQCTDEERRFPRFFFGSSESDRQPPCCAEAEESAEEEETTFSSGLNVDPINSRCSQKSANTLAGLQISSTLTLLSHRDAPKCTV